MNLIGTLGKQLEENYKNLNKVNNFRIWEDNKDLNPTNSQNHPWVNKKANEEKKIIFLNIWNFCFYYNKYSLVIFT